MCCMTPDDPELTEWQSYSELLKAMRRLRARAESLLERGVNGPLLSVEEVRDAQRELDTTRASVEQLRLHADAAQAATAADVTGQTLP